MYLLNLMLFRVVIMSFTSSGSSSRGAVVLSLVFSFRFRPAFSARPEKTSSYFGKNFDLPVVDLELDWVSSNPVFFKIAEFISPTCHLFEQ